MRLLVTGGAGFIGSEFVRMTLREHPGDSVTVLDKLTYAGNERNLDPVRSDRRFRFVRGDICDDGASDPCKCVVPAQPTVHRVVARVEPVPSQLDLASDVPRLPGDTDDVFREVVVGLELVVGNGPVGDR